VLSWARENFNISPRLPGRISLRLVVVRQLKPEQLSRSRSPTCEAARRSIVDSPEIQRLRDQLAAYEQLRGEELAGPALTLVLGLLVGFCVGVALSLAAAGGGLL
jgi:hypothetical protein